MTKAQDRDDNRKAELVDLLVAAVDQSPAWTQVFPEAKTGDGAPDTHLALVQAIRAQVDEWVALNVPTPLTANQVHDALLDLVPCDWRQRVWRNYAGVRLELSPYCRVNVLEPDADQEHGMVWSIQFMAKHDGLVTPIGAPHPLDFFQTPSPADAYLIARRLLDYLGWPCRS